ncbi:MAG: NusG domain II-containing protein, partial [Thermotogaceae bacterium]|nr:NusG domain II-containing protein [Thermotogaceae bacterium]
DKPGTYPIYKGGEKITTLIFNGKKARVVNSVCPLKICEKIGWIEPGGEIICVPNKLVIKFKEAKIDIQTW